MLNRVEHEKSFKTSGPDCTCIQKFFLFPFYVFEQKIRVRRLLNWCAVSLL